MFGRQASPVLTGCLEALALDGKDTGPRRLTVREADVHAADTPILGVDAADQVQPTKVAGLRRSYLAVPGVVGGRLGVMVEVVSHVSHASHACAAYAQPGPPGGLVAAMPVSDLEHGTACVLAATEDQLSVACRTDAGGPTVPPGITIDAVGWQEVGIGPQGLVGRAPGGLLGGPEATYHLLTLQVDARLFEARLPGAGGMEVVEDFIGVARQAGASDLEP